MSFAYSLETNTAEGEYPGPRMDDRPASHLMDVSSIAVAQVAEDAQRVGYVAGLLSNPKRCQVLFYVAQFPGLSISDLAVLINSSVPLASYHVTHLMRDGWVEVRQHRRRRLVTQTGDRRVLVEFLRSAMVSIHAAVPPQDPYQHREARQEVAHG